MRRPTRGGAGFTVIETVIAMALLAFIVGDVALVAQFGTRTSSLAQRITGAVSLAENAIEHARNADFNRIGLADNAQSLCYKTTHEPVACGDPAAAVVRECFGVGLDQLNCGSAAAFFSREREVTVLAGALAAQIDVVVAWTDARVGPQQYHLASIVSRF